MGLSVYFYPWGITSANELTADQVVVQKHKPGPFLYGGLTPVNFNLNQPDPNNPNNDLSFSALIFELMLGAGFDYPLRPNSILSFSFNYRFGSASDNSELGEVSYRGFGLQIGFTANYF